MRLTPKVPIHCEVFLHLSAVIYPIHVDIKWAAIYSFDAMMNNLKNCFEFSECKIPIHLPRKRLHVSQRNDDNPKRGLETEI